jgi:hypothetical protein
MAKDYSLSLIIRAIDKATEPLRRVNERIRAFTAPVRKLNNSFRALAAEAGLPRLAKSLGGVGTALGRVGHETWALGKRFALMGAAAAFAIYRIVSGAVEAGDKLAEMSDRVGLSVDAYAQLQFAAAQADVDQEAFNSAMDQFNKRLGEARAGSGAMLAFLNRVSPELARQVKAAKSTDEALGLMADAFAKIQDPAKRAALSAAAFGRSGLQMGQFLGQGSRALAEQRKRYLELAGSQEKFARGASSADNALRETGVAFGGLRNRMMGALFPAIEKLAKALTKFLEQHGDKLVAWAERAAKVIEKWVDSGGIERLKKQFIEWKDRIQGVVDTLGGFKGVMVIVAAVIAGPVVASIYTLTSAVWALGVALMATPVGWILAALAGLAIIAYVLYENWDNLGEIWQDWWETKFIQPWKDFGTIMGRWWSNWWETQFIQPWKDLGTIIEREWGRIVDWFVQTWETKVKPIVDNIRKPLEWMGALESQGGGEPSTLGRSVGQGVLGALPGGGFMRIAVDFNNMPRGTRVETTAAKNADVNLGLGYALTE